MTAKNNRYMIYTSGHNLHGPFALRRGAHDLIHYAMAISFVCQSRDVNLISLQMPWHYKMIIFLQVSCYCVLWILRRGTSDPI